MSQQNVDLVMALHDAFNRGDLDSLLSNWAPECEYRAAMTQVVEGEAGVFRGHDGLRRWWNDLRDYYDDLSTEVLEARDLGEQVLLVFLIRGRAKGSGLFLPEGNELAQVSTVHEGKVTEARDYLSRAEGLEAVGLSE
jgi:ketosteroid isomerase-like protein